MNDHLAAPEGGITIRPMRVGKILDRSFKLFLKMFSPQMITVIVILSAFETFGYYFKYLADNKLVNPTQLLIYTLIFLPAQTIVATYMRVFSVLVANNLWLQKGEDIWQIMGRIRFMLLLRIYGMFILVGLGIFGYSLLLLIPGIIYACNRALALYGIVIENERVKESMERSKQLMTFAPNIPWYSPRHPLMRFSAIGLITGILSFFPGMIIGAGQYTGNQGSAYTGLVATCEFIGLNLANMISLIGSLAMTGFYYDLRARAEGLDIQQGLDSLNQTSSGSGQDMHP